MAIDMTGYNAKFDSIKDKMQALGSDIQALPRTLTAIDNGMDTISGGGGEDLDYIKFEDLTYSIMFGTPLLTDEYIENETLPECYKLLDKILLGVLL